jgi:hypothetical protein
MSITESLKFIVFTYVFRNSKKCLGGKLLQKKAKINIKEKKAVQGESRH